MKQKVRKAFVPIFITTLGLFFFGLTALDSLAAGREEKHVFVLNSYHRGFLFSDNEMNGIDDAFAKSGVHVETYVTYMDLKRIPPAPQNFLRLKELIREGYKKVRFDVVIAADNDALGFIRKYRDELFPGVPVVFAGINNYDERMLDGRKDITGAIEKNDYAGTIDIALKLRPAAKNIVVVTDNTTTGKALHSEIVKVYPNYPKSIIFTNLSLGDTTMDELALKLARLKSDSIVLLLHQSVDKNGTSYTLQDSISFLTKSSAAPVFVVNDSRMGFGALGGKLVNGYYQGETAAQMALKILSGVDVKTIPVLLESPNKFMFDYSVMRRFGIAERDLPKGSIVINKPVSLLDRYRNEILFILAGFVVLCGLIVYLLFEVRRRKRAENEVSGERQRLAGIIEGTNVGTWEWNVRTGETIYNERWAEIIGYTLDEISPVSNETWRKFTHPDDQKAIGMVLERHFRGELDYYEFESRMKHKDGSWVWVLDRGKVVTRLEDGSPLLMLGTHQDITRRKHADEERAKLEAQLLQAQKMEAIGQLAGGVAHDFNNILAAIVSFGYLLEMQLAGNEKGAHYISQILQAAERAAALTQSLLAFSRKQHSNPRPIDLNATIKKTEKILARTIGEDIQLSLKLTEQNTAVHADSNQIDQILMNFAANAMDSMPKGGTLTIETSRGHIDNAFKELHGYGSDGEYVVMTVTDSGTGMDAATRKRVFEPFFTTKEIGKGTGLGLSMVYGIVKQHNGFIDVYSEVGKGTAFKVYFPALEMQVDTQELKRHFEYERATETILVVEDDSMLRRAITQMLQSVGHTVIEACDGDEAVAKFRAHKDEIHLVIMDVIMPHKSGGDAYQELKAIQPDVKIIMTSGYAGDYLAGKLGMKEEVHFIEKPVSPKELFKKIRSVLSGGTE